MEWLAPCLSCGAFLFVFCGVIPIQRRFNQQIGQHKCSTTPRHMLCGCCQKMRPANLLAVYFKNAVFFFNLFAVALFFVSAEMSLPLERLPNDCDTADKRWKGCPNHHHHVNHHHTATTTCCCCSVHRRKSGSRAWWINPLSLGPPSSGWRWYRPGNEDEIPKRCLVRVAGPRTGPRNTTTSRRL